MPSAPTLALTDQVTDVDGYYNPPGPLAVDHGEGIYVYDRDGREYIDCASGTFNLSLGYSHPEIVQVIRDQSERLIHLTSSYQAEPVNQLVRSLVKLSAPNLTRAHVKSSGGSEANEGAIKMAQRFMGKEEVVSLFRSHHGQTAQTAGVSGFAFRREALPVAIAAGLQVPDPYCRRCFYREEPSTCGVLCVERIHDFIDYATADRVACIIVEPVSGSGGNIVPPPAYFPALRKLCDERGIVLIFDEIQTGVGRTGRLFAYEHFGVQPDILTLAKGLGGSGLPIAAILTGESLVGLPAHHHSFTYGANVMAAAAAVKTLEIVSRPAFLANVRMVGAQIKSRLQALKRTHSFIDDVRGLGLMIGVELVGQDGEPNAELANACVQRGLEYGLLLRTSAYGFGNVLKVRPPLVITPEEGQVLSDRLERMFESFR